MKRADLLFVALAMLLAGVPATILYEMAKYLGHAFPGGMALR